MTDIQPELQEERLFKQLKIEGRPPLCKQLIDLKEKAIQITRAKALIRKVSVQFKGDDRLEIDATPFNSHILSVNLTQSKAVFAGLVTLGSEFEEWSRQITDILHQYWIDHIGDQLLRFSIRAAEDEIKKRYRFETISWMMPGSMENWPISEQAKLFAILGETEDTIGVHLSKENIMRPLKTVSGLLFQSKEAFYSCQLCSKRGCDKRRADFDAVLARNQFGMTIDEYEEDRSQ